MIDFYVFLVFGLLSAVVLAFPARRSRWWRLAAVPLCMLALGLALRFCGRTYPGIYYPDSPLLNGLLNGNGLFTEIGYNLVLAFGVVDAAFLFLTLFRQGTAAPIVTRSLIALRLGLLVLTTLIIAYGFYYAVLLHEHWSQ
jgi:hypothetical protein